MVGFSFILKGIPCLTEAFSAFDAHNGYVATPKRRPLTLEFKWRCLFAWKSEGSGQSTFALAIDVHTWRVPHTAVIHNPRVGSRKYHHARTYGEEVMVIVYINRMRKVPCCWQQIAERRQQQQRPAPSCFSVAKKDHKAIPDILSRPWAAHFVAFCRVSTGQTMRIPVSLSVNLFL